MCPPNPPVAFSSWTDEMITLSLEDYNQGKPLPHNLLSDLNPYSYLPSNLPDGIGYFLSSEVKKDTQFGSWKANGGPCEIFANSVLTGWRTTFVFFEGRSPNEKKTDWVMQEYRITPKGLGDGSKAKDYGSLCRILQSEKRITDQGINMIALPKSNGTDGQGSKCDAQNGDVEAVSLTSAEKRNCALRGDFLELDDLADPQSPLFTNKNGNVEAVSLTSAEKRNCALRGDFLELDDLADPQSPLFTNNGNVEAVSLTSAEKRNCALRGDFLELDDLADPQSPLFTNNEDVDQAAPLTSSEKLDCALRGDFLELDDLADPQSPFSTSFNSSCPTLASEELFDSEMLLQELEDKKLDRKEQFKYTVSGTVKSNEVVMHPAIVGKLTSQEPLKSNCSLPALVVEGEKDGLVLERKQETEAVCSSKNASASSDHYRAVKEKRKEKKGVPGQIKKLQKFFCHSF